MQSGSARTPLIIAGVAALATYVAFGQHGPVGFLKSVGLMHRDHMASVHVAADRDDDDDAAQEKADAAQAKADEAQAKADKAMATVDQAREVAPFDSIVLTNNAEATIEIGDTQSVKITAPDGEHINTDVHDGKLVVSGHMAGVHIAVTVPHLQSLEVAGASKVKLVGLKDSIKIAAHGPVDLTASGSVDAADLTLDGPSKLSMKALETKNMTIRMNGTGDAEVFATETLTANVNGVGHVRYLGDPHTVSNIHGYGSVEKLQS